jgi:hypothetical protein
LKIYCDTSVLPHNMDQKTQLEERAALKQLAEKYSMFGSHLIHYEVMNTPDVTQRENLIIDYKALEPVSKDVKIYGFQAQADQYGGFVCYPLMSDVQDEKLRNELIGQGLEQRDAEHITQAVCNDCDVFLTCDVSTIIKPHGQWLEQRFPRLKVWRPTQLLAFIIATENDKQARN